MPKRGQTLPYKVEYQYPGRPRYRSAKPSECAALYEGRDIARRGAEVWVLRVDAEGSTVLAHYDADNPPPDTVLTQSN